MWRVGELVVYIGHPGYGTELLRIGQTVRITEDMGIGDCNVHGRQQGVDIDAHPIDVTRPPAVLEIMPGVRLIQRYGYCALCFRKPIDFKKTLNISDTIKSPTKETENA
jgi:hypothetical protein